MNDAKEAVCGEYAEVLHKEIAHLRDINKDLLAACEVALPGLRHLEKETQFAGVRADAQMAANTVEDAIRKAKAEGK